MKASVGNSTNQPVCVRSFNNIFAVRVISWNTVFNKKVKVILYIILAQMKQPFSMIDSQNAIKLFRK